MTAKLIQDTPVSKIAEKYRQEGYTVFVEPEPEDIPFYSNPCRSRKSFYPTPTLPLVRGGSKTFTNDLGLLYLGTDRSNLIVKRNEAEGYII
ncbi:MAG: hypothetical protein U7126_06405 [Microcoleus sp.]